MEATGIIMAKAEQFVNINTPGDYREFGRKKNDGYS